MRPDRAELRRQNEGRAQGVAAEARDLRDLPIFGGIPERAREAVVERVRKHVLVRQCEPGEVILREGEYSDSAFFIADGAVEVVLPDAAAGATARVRSGAAAVGPARDMERAHQLSRMIGRSESAEGSFVLFAPPAGAQAGRTLLGAGEIFGEIAALSRYAVSATVRAETRTRLLQIRLPGLRMLMASSEEFRTSLDRRYRERSLARHLEGVPLFFEVGAEFIESLKERAELLHFDPGQTIVREGDPADAFYLVRGGFVKVSVQVGRGDLVVTYLRKGDHAGEAALLGDETWRFTLQALDHVEMVKLGKDLFGELIAVYPGVRDELQRSAQDRLDQVEAVTRNPASSEYLQMAMETGLVNGESVLLIDLNVCTRCDGCVQACADTHGGTARFVREGIKYRNWLVPRACYQCTDPVCMIDCPTGAISRSAGSLEVLIQEATCIGCGNCAQRCPWNNITMVETTEKRTDGKPVELANKCDLCEGQPEGPACVQMCPVGASVRISFKDMDSVTATLK
jgi:CRP-like cAMP-binding protein/Fe-S-cluster-containing dehydrogenase component